SINGTNRLTGTMSWEAGAVSGALTVAGVGTLNLTGSANIKDLSGVLTNAGRINYSGDQFRLRGAPLHNLAGGVVDLQTDNALGWYYGSEEIHNAGLIRKSGGSATTTIYPALDSVGTVEVQSGTFYFISAANLGGSVAISMGGTADYGRFQFAAASTVAGSLNVAPRNGFRPHPGDSFLVLSYPSLTGSFTCMNGLDFGAGLKLEPLLTKNSLTLTAVSVPTNSLPALSLQPLGKALLLQWPIEFAGWQLLTTTNLAAPNWLPVSVTGTNNTILSELKARHFFRLQGAP
ncbi:MAG: hypothetical protein NT154_48570, partial [Verrucomicrobia bacterium]|nr:hypothetical protein [Verrucomicrobiota bacterium]